MRKDISVYYGRYGYRSKDTSHTSSQNVVQNVDGYCRGGYRSHTTHSSSHNPGDHGILFCVYIAYHCVNYSLRYNLRVDIRVDYGRCGSRSQDISNYSFHKYIEIVDGY